MLLKIWDIIRMKNIKISKDIAKSIINLDSEYKKAPLPKEIEGITQLIIKSKLYYDIDLMDYWKDNTFNCPSCEFKRIGAGEFLNHIVTKHIEIWRKL